MTYRTAATPHDLVFVILNGAVRAIDLHSGAVRWQFAPDDITQGVNVYAVDSHVFVSLGGELRCLEPADGVCRWRTTLTNDTSVRAMKLACVGDAVLVHFTGNVVCVDLMSGALRWRQRASSVVVPTR